VELPLLAVVLAGTAGALWIADDLDEIRFAFALLGYAGVPAAVLYAGARILYPEWPAKRPRLAHGLVAGIGLIFLTGVAPLVNALTTDGKVLKRTVPIGLGVATRDVKRGGLGWLYSTRRPF
jgi:hypothetical protein